MGLFSFVFPTELSFALYILKNNTSRTLLACGVFSVNKTLIKTYYYICNGNNNVPLHMKFLAQKTVRSIKYVVNYSHHAQDVKTAKSGD